ncbi:MAG: aldehyde ferredoxin oxidoreductase N-terminal domain-containing protein, partial [Chloroflexota bacterium]
MSFPGYAGRILFVDLTSGKTREEPLDDGVVERFLGGWGISNYLAHEVIPPHADPLGPENAIILGAGPFSGTTIPGSAKCLLTTKFPINGAFATAAGGGGFALRLKSCGYDHVVITGKAPRPVVLLFSTGRAELRDAAHLWGKDSYDTIDILWQQYWPCSVIPIGPAGENLVPNSITSVDKGGTLGRGGLAAVMGSKNLKAMVALQGERGVKVAQRLRFQQLADALHQRIMTWRGRPALMERGLLEDGISVATPYPLDPLPKEMEQVHVSQRRRLACPSCSLGEKSKVCLPDGPFAGVVAYMPHFWMESFGGDARQANDRSIKYSDALNRLGLCHMNFTHTFLFLCRLYQEGSITREDTGGVELKPDLDTALTVAHMTAHQEGLGKVMAGGAYSVIAHVGEKLGRRLEHVKGNSSVFDPRLSGLGTMEFSQMINPRGSHMAAGGSPSYAPGRPLEDFIRHAARMGATPEATARAVGPGNFNAGRYTRFSDDWYSL